MFILKENKVNFGEIHYKDKQTWETEIVSGLDEVDYVSGGTCPCTDAWIEGNKLKVIFNPKAAVGELKDNEFKASPKYLDIYLDKDKNEYISDPLTMRRIYNGEKRIVKVPIAYMAHGNLS